MESDDLQRIAMEVENIISMIPEWETALTVGGAAFLVALVSGVILTSMMCGISWRWGAVDKPDGTLKCHSRATATLGGIPLFLAILAGVVVSRWVGAWGDAGADSSYGALLVAGLIMLSLGVSDDLRGVMPRTKLLFQMLTAMVLVGSGVLINRCEFFNVFGISLGVIAVPFTLFWLVGSCNAFNFIDGMDGLASGVGTVIALVLACLGLLTENYAAAVLALVVAGALLSILLFNIKPAVIFLGDSGSQLIGLILGVLTIKVATVQGVFLLPCAGVVLSVPIIDAALAVLRRYSCSDSPACGDHKHIHHRLAKHGLSVNQVSMTLWAAVALTGAMAVIFCQARGVAAGLAALAFVTLELYVGIRMGCLEPHLLWGRLTSKYRWKVFDYQRIGNSTGKAELQILWERMKPLFEQTHLDRAILTLESVSDNGRSKYETYQWTRSEDLMAELLARRWTKRFALGEDDRRRIATLQLESADHLRREEAHIDWLLQQIAENMHHVSHGTTGRDLPVRRKPPQSVEYGISQ